MLLPEIVLEFFTEPMYYEYGNLNHVLIKCSQEQKENVRKQFTEEYMSKVQDEMKELADSYGCVALYNHDLNCFDVIAMIAEHHLDYVDENLDLIKSGDYYSTFDLTEIEEYGITIWDRDDGFLIEYEVPMYISDYGVSLIEGSGAVSYSLEKLVKQFPDVKYYGYAGFFANDDHGGECYQGEFYSSEEDRPVPDDYIGDCVRSVDWEEKFDIYEKNYEEISETELEELFEFAEVYAEYIDASFYKAILKYAIKANKYILVKEIINRKNIVTEENIMDLIDYAIENTQNGGDMQIQVLLMNYKHEHFPHMDPMKDFQGALNKL